MNDLLPSDESWHTDKAFITELTPLIAQLSKYVMRYFDVDAGRDEPMSAADERALGERMANLATELQARADRHAALGEQPPMVEGDVEHSSATDVSQEEQP